MFALMKPRDKPPGDYPTIEHYPRRAVTYVAYTLTLPRTAKMNDVDPHAWLTYPPGRIVGLANHSSMRSFSGA